ncbi:MAG: molybdopterin-dependent oxidoreductase [Coriobacteriia bacterium]|nr:molybdopterin-dependent oxidoreductase [Coriobacteriia bacterium]
MAEERKQIVLPYDMPNKYVDEHGVQWTYSRCFYCHLNCGIVIGVDTETDRIVEIKPNWKEGTVLCDRIGEKGQKAIQMHYHPKRINHAMKRIGKRGEDRWQEIPLEQAMDEIADKIKELIAKYGPETLVSFEGTYRSDHLWSRTRFMNYLGNPGNVCDPGTICWCWNYSLNMAMVGWPIEALSPVGIDYADTFVIWGLSASEKYGPQSPMWRQYLAAMNRPGKKPKMIVIDPYCTTQALLADIWLPIYPGTDHALSLAWLNQIIENEWYNTDFIKYWSNGVFLMTKENRHLLRADEVFEGEEHGNFIVWDQEENAPLVWNSDINAYKKDGAVDAAIDGEFTVTLKDGSKVECLTAWAAVKEMAEPYTPQWASPITGIPENKIIDSARVYATNGHGFITWGLGGGDQHGPNASNLCITKTIMRIILNYIDVPGGEYVGEPGPVPDLDGTKHFPYRDSELEMSEVVDPEVRKKYIGWDHFRAMSWQGFEIIDREYRKIHGVPRPMLHQLLCSPVLMYDAMEFGDPYPVKGMIIWSSNPMAWAPDPKRLWKIMKEDMELIVDVEYWKTPAAALADYIIPACDSLERPCYTTAEDANDFSVCGDRGSKPVGDRIMDYDFFRKLGIRLGEEEQWPWETYEDLIKFRISRGTDLTYDQLVEQGTYFPSTTRFYKYAETLPNGQTCGFATPSRKAEIVPCFMEDLGYSPLPYYHELPETPLSDPELAEKYPLRLTTGGRVSVLYHSENRVPGQGTRSIFPYPSVYIHREDARKYGIRDGEWVWIENERGRIKQVAHVDQAIIKGTVQAMPSWWYPELPAEDPWNQGAFISNVNVLVDGSVEGSDAATATWTTRGLLCRVYPCIDPADRTDQWFTGADYLNGGTYFNDQFDKLGCVELRKLDESQISDDEKKLFTDRRVKYAETPESDVQINNGITE